MLKFLLVFLFFVVLSWAKCAHPCKPVPPTEEECLKYSNLGEQICIVKGSAVLMPTYDALVNAANDQLQNGGGIAAAFVTCGGQIIQDECNAIIAKVPNNVIPTSHNAVTTCGCMPNPHLINAVGPIWDNARVHEVEQLLMDTAANIIRTARYLCAESVAIPLISAGIFGFGAEKSAELLTRGALDFYLYNYETATGKYSQAVIDEAVRTTRFPPAKNCSTNGLYPKKITFVGFYTSHDDMKALRAAMKRRQAEVNHLRSTFTGTGTFTETDTTAPPTKITLPAPTRYPHNTCGGMSCGALAALIVVIIVILCIGAGIAYVVKQRSNRGQYSAMN